VIIVYNPASAREIIVDNNGSGADFRSIQEAVNNSSSGDTVIVMPGIYNESIIVNITSLTIRSESKNSEVLVKSPEENKSIFLITANNVTLSGFNITGAKGNYTYYPSGICLKNTRNCKITGNTLFENYLGVYLVNADQNTISENLLFDSSIYLNERRKSLLKGFVLSDSIDISYYPFAFNFWLFPLFQYKSNCSVSFFQFTFLIINFFTNFLLFFSLLASYPSVSETSIQSQKL
jgi:parallel beta-helix repeat protein